MGVMGLLALAACSRASAEKPLAFAEQRPGIQYAAFESGSGRPFSGHVFVVDLTRVDVRLLPATFPPGRQTVDAIAAAFPEVVAVNASFFDPDGKAMGRTVDRGVAMELKQRAGWGALVVDKGSARVVLGDTLPRDTPGGDVVVQGLPRLIVDGAVTKLKEQSAARTAVCADGSTLTVVVTSEAETSALARFLIAPRERGGLGCKDALNLDGGPSTQLSARLGAFTARVAGGWGVPNALVVLPRSAPRAVAPDAGPTAP